MKTRKKRDGGVKEEGITVKSSRKSSNFSTSSSAAAKKVNVLHSMTNVKRVKKEEGVSMVAEAKSSVP